MPRKHRHSSEGSDLTGPTSGPHHVRRESRGTMLGDRTRLLARLGGSSQKRRALPVKVLAKLPGPGDVVAARRSRPTKCQPLGQYHVRRESLGAMPGDRAWPTTGLGRVPPGDAGHYPVWSGPKLSGPGGVSTARRTRITRAEPPAYTMHTGSHTASTPGDRAWPTAGRGRVPPGYDVYYRTGLGSSSRTPEASTQLGWPRITKAELRDTACTPGVSRHNAGQPDMAYCRTESPAVKWSSRIRHAQPDRSGLGSGPRAGRHSPEYSDHQCRALGVAVHSGQATRFRPGPGHHSILQSIFKSAGRVQSPHDSSP